ncbi:glycosyl hydrolase family 79 N-terminal domain-containing protein [Salinibius halmophilus]|uniref:hypothetical protein n=1 Tax=Salinibius halmophilus TaxID=1853216 RepID=UPI001314E374|nr:hypothetical protein [Salinibius halmophilus]
MFVLVALAASGPKRDVTIALDNTIVDTVHAPYIGLAIDTALVVGGEWWDGLGTRSNRSPLDLTDPRLIQAITQTGTDLLRIGGTEADKLYLGEYVAPGFDSHLTSEQWQQILDLGNATNSRILFSANAGPATRDDQHRWQSEQFERLLNWTPQGANVDFELGNEFNAHWIFFGWRQQAHFDQYMLDYAKADTLLADRSHRLAGPANAFWPYLGEPGAFLFGSSQDLFALQPDIFTWHFYPTQSVRCGVATQNAFQRHLKSLDLFKQSKAMAEKIQRWNQGSEVWLGETGPAQCGGQAGVTDRAGSALWWLSHTGLMARTGNHRIIRQSLLGSDYALMDEQYRARPDYYATLLFNQLMGEEVLNTNMTPNRSTRVFAHCHAKLAKQAMLLVINMDDKPQTLHIEQGSRWLLINANRYSDQFVTIHNRTVSVSSLANDIPWQPVDQTINLPGASYAFIEIDNMTVCQPQEDR